MTLQLRTQILRFAPLTAAATVGTFLAFPGVASETATTSPIKHVIAIFQENVSFDHYFATYPFAANKTAGEPKFFAAESTPAVNGLLAGPADRGHRDGSAIPFGPQPSHHLR